MFGVPRHLGNAEENHSAASPHTCQKDRDNGTPANAPRVRGGESFAHRRWDREVQQPLGNILWPLIKYQMCRYPLSPQ